jgi:formylglycine-generating enzyme required for sulfatase activity
MGDNPSKFTICGDNCPVEQVSWDDAQAFIQKLNAKTGKQYRLPSEAEWEYAARAGTKAPFYTGEAITHAQANFHNFTKRIEPVGSYPPNGFGLYDMAGNASQWADDCFNDTYDGAPTDGSAWRDGECLYRIIRGGNYYMEDSRVRSGSRSMSRAGLPAPHLGFRLERELAPRKNDKKPEGKRQQR